MKSLSTKEEKQEAVNAIMEEFINLCDEYLFCLSFSVIGIEEKGKEFKKIRYTPGQRIWLGSDLETNNKMHARMDIKSLIQRCSKNGLFTKELTKSFICMIYTMWDEDYRHKVSEAYDCEPEEIFCPLMGDLRKIRHCIIHHKSIVSDNGLSFEYLKWIFQPGPLNITYEMFREINDAIRGSGMKIHSLILAPELKQVLPLMSNKEKKSFDEFFNKFENKINSNIWPGMQNFLIKNIEKPGIKELATLSGFNKLVK